MKDIRAALFAFLQADLAIGAIVTSGSTSRIYPIRLPQGVKLASLVYTRVSNQTDYKMEGATGYARSRMQIDAWAPTVDAASSLANLVKDALSGFSGAIGNSNAVFVQGVFCADERESYDDTVQMFGVSRDYFIHHEEI